MSAQTTEPRLGLRPNLGQFALLVLVNAFVGAMVGLERSILPAIAEQDFHLAARAAVLSFIVVFGIVKALTNYVAGRLSDAIGRKTVLVAGWVLALPVPFLLMWAPAWNWILIANVLLGISQGLTWSTTVIMKIDLVGPLRRGWRWDSTNSPAMERYRCPRLSPDILPQFMVCVRSRSIPALVSQPPV